MNAKEKDVAESIEAGRLIRAKAKQCYKNAWLLIQAIPEYANADYVEGIAIVLGGLPIEHGWVERNDVIVDPTLPSKNMTYFPGLRFKGQRGLGEAMTIEKDYGEDDLPIFYRFGWGGIDSPEFRAALIAAYRHAGMEDMAKRYEEYQPLPIGDV